MQLLTSTVYQISEEKCKWFFEFFCKKFSGRSLPLIFFHVSLYWNSARLSARISGSSREF